MSDLEQEVIEIPFNNHGILHMAVTKAVNNGYRPFAYIKTGYVMSEDEIESTVLGIIRVNQTNSIIFDHDFAKALWGDIWSDQMTTLEQWEMTGLEPNWQRHLQQMVIADNKIKYLGENT